jgi:teichuronic acid exporter
LATKIIEKLKIGVLWSIIEVIVKRSLDFVVKLILARLLFPEEFGIVGMATVFTSFVQVINDAGMGPAIVQKKNVSEKLLNTVFWSNLVWSLVLFLVLSFVLAPLAATFYNQPILVKIVPVLSFSILTSALNTVHFSLLRRDLNFKKIAFVRNTSSFVAGAIAVLMAFYGYGVWALVANSIVAYLISVPLFYTITKWKPQLEWDKKILKEVLSFGVFITGSKIVLNLASNADYLLIGKIEGSEAVGIYTLAFMMTSLVMGQITTMLDTVMFPFYSKMQDDFEKLKRYYLILIGYYTLIIYPIMITLFLFTNEIVEFFFGIKWIYAVVPIKILSISVMVNILTSGYGLLLRSIGKPDREFRIQRITSLFVYMPCLTLGVYLYGTVGAAMGGLLASIFNFFILQYVLNSYFQIKLHNIYGQTHKVIWYCVFLVFFVYCLNLFITNKYFIFSIYTIVLLGGFILLFRSRFLRLLRN